MSKLLLSLEFRDDGGRNLMKTCCLCSNLASGGVEEWNRPLFESRNFVVLPSVGSLVEGWLMIVPKEHYISMGALPVELTDEMLSLKAKVTSQLRNTYGDLCAFEHGPGDAERRLGCGVDHAHLHVVPLAFNLAEAAAPFLPCDASWVKGGWEHCRVAFSAGKDYLYLEQPIGSGRIAVHDSIGSQVFRRAIAAHIGIPEQFNWREYPRSEVVSRTVRCVHRIVEVKREHLCGAESLA
jgi:ATP adenylyltransferase